MAADISEELKTALFQKYGKEFRKGDILFNEGDTAKEMYIIVDGIIDIFHRVHGLSEDEQILAKLKSGDFLGEMSILNNEPRSASARIAEDSKILVIDNITFKAMIRNNAEFAWKILSRLSERLRANNKKIEDLANQNKKGNVIKEIIHFQDSCTEDQCTVDRLTSHLIEEGICEDTEVEEIVLKLQKNEIIQVDETTQKISIPNREYIQNIASFIE